MKNLFLLIFLGFTLSLYAQEEQYTSTIRGRILDQETKYPLPGVSVALYNNKDSLVNGTSSDKNGYYRIKNLSPVKTPNKHNRNTKG